MEDTKKFRPNKGLCLTFGAEYVGDDVRVHSCCGCEFNSDIKCLIFPLSLPVPDHDLECDCEAIRLKDFSSERT